jgi:hypothetical protein
MIVSTYSLVLGVAVLLITPAAQPQQPHNTGMYTRPSTFAPSGAVVDGFTLAVMPAVLPMSINRPILVNVELRNVSGAIRHASFGSRHDSYAFTIVNLTHESILARNKISTFGIDPVPESANTIVPPRNALYAVFDLGLLYDFTDAPKFSVQVTGKPEINGKMVSLKSNKIIIELLPSHSP